MGGGALGVRIMTFDQLATECLDAAGQSYTILLESVQYRLMQSVVKDVDLSFYDALSEKPGFIQLLQSFVALLKARQT